MFELLDVCGWFFWIPVPAFLLVVFLPDYFCRFLLMENFARLRLLLRFKRNCRTVNGFVLNLVLFISFNLQLCLAL